MEFMRIVVDRGEKVVALMRSQDRMQDIRHVVSVVMDRMEDIVVVIVMVDRMELIDSVLAVRSDSLQTTIRFHADSSDAIVAIPAVTDTTQTRFETVAVLAMLSWLTEETFVLGLAASPIAHLAM